MRPFLDHAKCVVSKVILGQSDTDRAEFLPSDACGFFDWLANPGSSNANIRVLDDLNNAIVKLIQFISCSTHN